MQERTDPELGLRRDIGRGMRVPDVQLLCRRVRSVHRWLFVADGWAVCVSCALGTCTLRDSDDSHFGRWRMRGAAGSTPDMQALRYSLCSVSREARKRQDAALHGIKIPRPLSSLVNAGCIEH